MQDLYHPKDYLELSKNAGLHNVHTIQCEGELAITYRLQPSTTDYAPTDSFGIAVNQEGACPDFPVIPIFDSGPLGTESEEETPPADAGNDGIDIPPPEPPGPAPGDFEGDDDEDPYVKQAREIVSAQLPGAATGEKVQQKTEQVASALASLHKAQQAIAQQAGDNKPDAQPSIRGNPAPIAPTGFSPLRPSAERAEEVPELPVIRTDKMSARSLVRPDHSSAAESTFDFPEQPISEVHDLEIPTKRSESASSFVSFPGRIEIRHGDEVLIQAQAIRRAEETSKQIINEAGEAVIVGARVDIQQERMQTRPDVPPGVLRIETLTSQRDAMPSAIEAALKAYADAYIQFLMEPIPSMPGHVRFRPAVHEGSNDYTTESFPETVAKDHIIGEPDIGITRLLLDTYDVNLAALRQKTKVPEVKGVRQALERQGCRITKIEIVGLSSPYATDGILVHFERYKKTIEVGSSLKSYNLRRTR